MLVTENRVSILGGIHILQTDRLEHEINVFHAKIPAIHLDDAADGEIIFCPQVLCFVVGAILIQPGEVNIIALCPELFGFRRPQSAGKTGHFDLAERILL